MNNMSKVMIIKMTCCLIVASFRIAAYGQTQADTSRMSSKLLELSFEDLMNVRVITPTRSLLQSNQAPATVLVVTDDQIRMRGYRNLAEILNDLPDMNVSDKVEPQFYNAVTVRGIYRQDYFVILIDGIRISSPTNEPLPILENFPIYLAKQIEVVYGPGSALYGADAMACIINIITRGSGEGEELRITTLAGTQGYSGANGLFNKKLTDGLNVSIGGQYSYDMQPDYSKVYPNAYDMTSQRTGQFNTSYGLQSTENLRGAYEAPIKTYNVFSAIEKGEFSVKLLHHYAQVPSSTAMKPDNAVFNDDVFYGQSVTTASTSYSASSKKMKLISNLTGSFYRVNPKSNFRNLYGGMEHGYKYSTGSMIKMEEQLNYFLSKKLTITSGLMYEIFHSVPKSQELTNPIRPQSAASGILLNSVASQNPRGIEAKFFPLYYTNIGCYIQSQYLPITKLSMTTGVRFDYNSRFGLTVNPRVGAVFQPTKTTTVKTLFGTAFWAPSPMITFDTYGSFNSTDNGLTYQSSYWHLPNPDLKPMTSHTFELSIHQKFSSRLSFSVTGYKTAIKGVIENVSDSGNTNLYNNHFLGWPVSYIDVPYNRGTQENYGGNVTVDYKLQMNGLKMNVYSSASYVEGYVSDSDISSPVKIEQGVIAPWRFRLGVDGQWAAFYFSTRLIHTGRQRTMALRENSVSRQSIDGYSLLNLSFGYTFKNLATLFVNVQNAIDTKYTVPLAWDASQDNSVSFGSAYQDPRRIMIGLRVSLGQQTK